MNGKTYIGLDTNNNPSYFGSGIAIKNAIKKYGKENFKKDTVESGFKSLEDLCKAEIKWIAQERITNILGTYNMHSGGLIGDSNRGKTWSQVYGEEKSKEILGRVSSTLKKKGIRPPSRLGLKGSDKQREAARKTCKSRKQSKEEIENLIARTIRPIVCLQNNVRYSSLKEAAESLGLSKGNICSVLKGNRKNTKGFTFKYLEQR